MNSLLVFVTMFASLVLSAVDADAAEICRQDVDKSCTVSFESKETADSVVYRISNPRVNGLRIGIKNQDLTAYCQALFPDAQSPAFGRLVAGVKFRYDEKFTAIYVEGQRKGEFIQGWFEVFGQYSPAADAVTCYVNN